MIPDADAREALTLAIADTYGVGFPSGRRAAAVRSLLDESEARWAQRLRALVWTRPDVEAANPVLVHRLRRQMPRLARV